MSTSARRVLLRAFCSSLLFCLPAFAADGGSPSEQPAAPAQGSGKWMKLAAEGKDLYATIKTTLGDITVRLFSKDAPKTVENFVGLASGEKDWTDPRTHEPRHGVSLYKGTIFHRVIPEFMIQGGDPTGTGMGDPGYRFEDEFQSGRRFDKPGLLAMANAGPGTNGSQFFITTSTPEYLNNHHTIFGEVVAGYDVVDKISRVPTQPGDRPITDVAINDVVLSEKPPKGVKVAKDKPAKAKKKKLPADAPTAE